MLAKMRSRPTRIFYFNILPTILLVFFSAWLKQRANKLLGGLKNEIVSIIDKVRRVNRVQIVPVKLQHE